MKPSLLANDYGYTYSFVLRLKMTALITASNRIMSSGILSISHPS